MVNIINVEYKSDLITVDLRTRQIRYLHNVISSGKIAFIGKGYGEIEFITLSHDDVAGYEYLFEHDKKLFFKSLIEDVDSNLGLKLELKYLKVKS